MQQSLVNLNFCSKTINSNVRRYCELSECGENVDKAREMILAGVTELLNELEGPQQRIKNLARSVSRKSTYRCRTNSNQYVTSTALQVCLDLDLEKHIPAGDVPACTSEIAASAQASEDIAGQLK
jgi:hypothetical protein